MGDAAEFDEEAHSFVLSRAIPGCKQGKYELLSCLTDGIPYRLSHPLGQYVLHILLYSCVTFVFPSSFSHDVGDSIRVLRREPHLQHTGINVITAGNDLIECRNAVTDQLFSVILPGAFGKCETADSDQITETGRSYDR
ncbi:MAG: hypothetical protein IKX16_03560 [Clostridia bacterium]|nr:hypothetical protein [Clostridia bacterium]